MQEHKDEIETILAKYPGDQRRSAVMPLLYLAQQEYGYLTPAAIEEVANLAGVSSTEVASLIGFYTLFRGKPGGRYRIQVCTDLPCALRGADTFVQQLCANVGIRLGEATPDGLITIEEVMCLAGCDKAPVLQVQDESGVHYHENQSAETVMKLIDDLRQRRADG